MSGNPEFSRIGIVGLGLLGGSVAKALKKAHPQTHISGFSLSSDDMALAEREGVIDNSCRTADEAVLDRDLVVYATPLAATLDLLSLHCHNWSPGTLVTDVVSLKGPVLSRILELGEASRYVGSHPMAGGEGTGYSKSRNSLFRDAVVWLAEEGAEDPVRGRVERLWTELGAVPLWIDAQDHDLRMVWVSHLPQLLSNALGKALLAQGYSRADLGPGGRDMTRLAGSSPDMWRDLLRAAGPDLAQALQAMGREVEQLQEWLSTGEIEPLLELMSETRKWQGGGE